MDDSKKYRSNVASSNKQASDGLISQHHHPRVQEGGSAVPFELVHALLKANNGDVKASMEGVKEGFDKYRIEMNKAKSSK